MSWNFLELDIISSFFGFLIGFFSFSIVYGWRYYQKNHNENEYLHWNPLVERRGLGDLIVKVNHIAIAVSNVGKSLNFYVDVLGLQQIRRPTFDRHGAWLTMGNIELHLIKGIPVLPPVDNLQVGHIALETRNIDRVIDKLRELNIEIRQSLNVTNAHQPKSPMKSRIIQYFFNDPDGYYLELCNCDVLTEFSFSQNPLTDEINYQEKIHNGGVFEIAHIASHWKTIGFQHSNEELEQILNETPRANQIDEEKFDNLLKRRSVYGDIIQGFTDDQIKEALLRTNNIIPLTIKYLQRKRGDKQYFQPPAFIENENIIEPQPFIVQRKDFK